MVKKNYLAGVRERAKPSFVYYIDCAAETLYGPLSGTRSTEYSTKTGQMEIVNHKKIISACPARSIIAARRFQSFMSLVVLFLKRKRLAYIIACIGQPWRRDVGGHKTASLPGAQNSSHREHP